MKLICGRRRFRGVRQAALVDVVVGSDDCAEPVALQPVGVRRRQRPGRAVDPKLNGGLNGVKSADTRAPLSGVFKESVRL
jgi:hypothetical protein